MRTFTRYFTVEDIAPITVEFEKLDEEWRDRRPHVSTEDQLIGDGLLADLLASISKLLTVAG